MPLQPCKAKGRKGTRWGRKGKCYVGLGARKRALRQARAILATGWTENAIKRKPNPLRSDPTRTATLRRKFQDDLNRRFKRFTAALRDLVVREDAFGLRQTRNVFCPTGEGGGIDPTCPAHVGSRNDPIADLRVYHGGTAKEGKYVTYYTTDKKAAESYAQMYKERFGKGGAVHESNLTLKNPAPASVVASEARRIGIADEDYTPASVFDGNLHDEKDVSRLVERLKSLGYDGTILGDIPYGEGKEINAYIKFSGKSTLTPVPTPILKGVITTKSGGIVPKATLHAWIDREPRNPRMKTQWRRRKDSWLIKHGLIENVFCPTGPGGGVDPTCPAHTSQTHVTKTAAFKQWFGDSKVVGEKGEPLVMYHGTKSDFDEFDVTKTSTKYKGTKFPGFYFTSDPGLAGTYGRGQGHNIKPVFIKIQNPATPKMYYENGVEKLKAMGYDGVLSPSNRVAIVFFSNQIKAAIGNRGTFDPDDPIITHAASPRFAFLSTPEQLRLFQAWLNAQIARDILPDSQSSDVDQPDEYWQRYVQEGYQRGAGRAFDDTRKPYAREYAKAGAGVSDFYWGSRYEFLRSAFGRPVAVEKVKLLASRTFTDLKGVTDQMATKLSRSLTDGLVQGDNPNTIASRMYKDVGISLERARTVARTEIIRTHAEGQLDAFEQLGVEQLGVMAEWHTAEDSRVCELCSSMEGVVLKIQEARGMIPRHVNCRCALIPANIGERRADQVRSKSDIQDAIRESLDAERPATTKRTLSEQRERTTWAGSRASISKARPQSVLD